MSRSPKRTIALGLVCGVTAVAATVSLSGGLPAGAAPTGPSGSAAAKQSVIVLLRDQLTATPATRTHVAARRADARTGQDRVLARLGGPAPTKVDHYTAANAFSATVTAAQAAALAADPSVARVVPNVRIQTPSPTSDAGTTASSTTPGRRASRAAAVATTGPYAVCPSNPAKPLLEPEALSVVRAASDDPSVKTAAGLGIDGRGVKVAYIADGINPKNKDFVRADGTSAIVDYQAFSSDGPNPYQGGVEAYGDASSIAAQGRIAHDLSTYAIPSQGLPTGCTIRIRGMAPGVGLVALKTDLTVIAIIQAIDYAVSVAHVSVINESFGSNAVPDLDAREAVSAFNDMAVDAGVTVTTSTGDSGTTSTIGTPATDPKVISVAATGTGRWAYQDGGPTVKAFGNGTWVNNDITDFSSGGYTQSGGTVDLAAPGAYGWVACDESSPECSNDQGGTSNFTLFGGTSESAPLTAGAAALVIQAYRSTHGGASPTPALVKRLLTSTARDLGLPTFAQGAGLLDARAAVEAALTYPGATKAAPSGTASNIVVSKSQVSLFGKPGSRKTVRLGVRNVGRKTLTVAASTRDYATLGVSTGTGTLPGSPVPGSTATYRKITFTVPVGTDRLSSSLVWAGRPQTVGGVTAVPPITFRLFDPSGAFVSVSSPDNAANHDSAEVPHPTAGTWTAIASTAGTGGYSGSFTLQNTFQEAVGVGSLNRPVFTLRPGQRKTLKVQLQIPTSAGDTSQAITLASSDGHRTAVPVVLRSVIPTTGGTGSFAGTITGGNGRLSSWAQSFTYAFDVPRGTQDVSAGVTLADDPGIEFAALLLDPNNEVQSIGSNVRTDAADNPTGLGLTAQASTASVVAGRWRVVVVVANPLTGKELGEKFTGTIGYNRNKATATGVPNSAAVVLPRGVSAAASVKVTNTGIAPIQVQLDPRTSQLRQIPLASPFGAQTFTLPKENAPNFLVPPQTTGLTAALISEVPALAELTSPAYGIDTVGSLQAVRGGSSISVVRVSEAPDTISSGLWFVSVGQIGAVPAGGSYPTGSATVQLTARTKAFDPAVTSSTGDFWVATADPTADIGTPVVIQPGATATVQVAISPTAAVGRVVSGTLDVVTPPSFANDQFATTGDVLAKIPYRYTVGAAPSSSAATAADARAKLPAAPQHGGRTLATR